MAYFYGINFMEIIYEKFDSTIHYSRLITRDTGDI